jgi:hypothetical protein
VSFDFHDAQKHFTIDEANAMLPLVRAIAADLITVSRAVVDRRQRLDQIANGQSRSEDDPYAAEVLQIEEEVAKDSERLKGYVEELLQLGVEPKSVTMGLVDFPTIMDGQPAYLCWKYDEPEIIAWHEIDAGFAERKSLVADITTDHVGIAEPAEDF